MIKAREAPWVLKVLRGLKGLKVHPESKDYRGRTGSKARWALKVLKERRARKDFEENAALKGREAWGL